MRGRSSGSWSKRKKGRREARQKKGGFSVPEKSLKTLLFSDGFTQLFAGEKGKKGFWRRMRCPLPCLAWAFFMCYDREKKVNRVKEQHGREIE
ncbi:hypothetical protein DW757_03145 [Clostridium sp. AM29-11AC]|uniref:hypothetical protein n=1 Tax=Clostridium sp. AM29-11AC TaxID=2293028 RepID=UPI000E4F4511|nr:hypothetical protein [Clostridium sp. AM29-11AC]RHT58605.1 hypothetical protein DW757_03145 [Clostridium sp. AM29-11AC]